MPSNHFMPNQNSVVAARDLRVLLEYGARLFEVYTDGGRKKFDAMLLRNNNERIRDTALRLAANADESARKMALDLAYHADTFVLEWDAFDDMNDVGWNEEFAYATRVPFPARAAEELTALAD